MKEPKSAGCCLASIASVFVLLTGSARADGPAPRLTPQQIAQTAAHQLKPLVLGDSSLATAGEHVVAIGNPLGLGSTVSDGLLSAIATHQGAAK